MMLSVRVKFLMSKLMRAMGLVMAAVDVFMFCIDTFMVSMSWFMAALFTLRSCMCLLIVPTRWSMDSMPTRMRCKSFDMSA